MNQSPDPSSPIDSSRWAGQPLRVLALSFVVMTIDGYDLQSMAFAAPALAVQWRLSRELLGPVLAASIVGMAFGSIAFGWLGDRIGRKRSLIACIALLGCGSLAGAYATHLHELATFRVITGLGLGGATPLATSLIAEWTPLRWRSLAIAIGIVGVPLGGTLGAALAARVIPLYGWQSVFVIGAVLPAALLAVVIPALPESPLYVADHRGHSTTAARQGGILALLDGSTWVTSLLLWFAFAGNSLALYSFVNWLPTVLTSAGLPLEAALRGSVFFNAGGMVGALLGSALISRHGSQRVGSSVALAGAVSIGLIGTLAGTSAVGGGHGALLVLVALAGAALNGMQNFLYAVSANAYATSIRALGVGCASAMARVGAVLSSALGSAVFAWGLSTREFFYVIALVVVATLVCFHQVPRHIVGRPVG